MINFIDKITKHKESIQSDIDSGIKENIVITELANNVVNVNGKQYKVMDDSKGIILDLSNVNVKVDLTDITKPVVPQYDPVSGKWNASTDVGGLVEFVETLPPISMLWAGKRVRVVGKGKTYECIPIKLPFSTSEDLRWLEY
jgi:hypothetical protein